jgi:hypothetical protein
VNLWRSTFAAHRSTSRVGGPAGRAGKKSMRDVALELIKALLNEQCRESFSHKEAIECCTEAGCKNPTALVSQLNEFGLILKSGEKYKIRRTV